MYLTIRAFFSGLGIVALGEMFHYALKISGINSEAFGLFVFSLSIFWGSIFYVIRTPHLKFSTGILFSVPATFVLGLMSQIALYLGINTSDAHQGMNHIIFIVIMDFPLVFFICIFGTIIGCLLPSFKSKNHDDPLGSASVDAHSKKQ